MSDAVESSAGEPPLVLTGTCPRAGVLVVEIVGELDIATAPRVTDFLHEHVHEGVHHLVLDLTHVEFLDSHGVTMLVTALGQAAGTQRLHLIGAVDNRRVWRVIELTGLTDVFHTHSDIHELLDELDLP